MDKPTATINYTKLPDGSIVYYKNTVSSDKVVVMMLIIEIDQDQKPQLSISRAPQREPTNKTQLNVSQAIVTLYHGSSQVAQLNAPIGMFSILMWLLVERRRMLRSINMLQDWIKLFLGFILLEKKKMKNIFKKKIFPLFFYFFFIFFLLIVEKFILLLNHFPKCGFFKKII